MPGPVFTMASLGRRPTSPGNRVRATPPEALGIDKVCLADKSSAEIRAKDSVRHAPAINGGPRNLILPAEARPKRSSTYGYGGGIGSIARSEGHESGEAMSRFLREAPSDQPWNNVTYFAKGRREEEEKSGQIG